MTNEINVLEFWITNIKEEFPDEYLLLDWQTLSLMKNLSEEFMDSNWELLDKQTICNNQKLSLEFVKKHFYDMDFRILSNTHKHLFEEESFKRDTEKLIIPKGVLEKVKIKKECSSYLFEYLIELMYKDYYEDFLKLDFACISRYRNLTPAFMDKFERYLKWAVISSQQSYFTESLFDKCNEKINYKSFSGPRCNVLTLNTLIKYSNRFDLKSIKKNLKYRSMDDEIKNPIVIKKKNSVNIRDDNFVNHKVPIEIKN